MVKFTVDDFRVAYIFDVESPILETDLANALEKQGFTIFKSRYFAPVNVPIRVNLISIATIGKVSVLYQSENIPSFIGVAGRVPDEVLKHFETLNQILNQIDPTLLQRMASIEAVVTGKVWAEKFPKDTIPKLGGPLLSKLAMVTGSNVKLGSVLIGPDEDQPKWSLRIEPLFRSPRYYYVQYVRQGVDLKEVLSNAYMSGEFITEITSLMERKEK